VSFAVIVPDGLPLLEMRSLDICVLSEKVITHGDIIVRAHPIGGFRMIDRGQADDKIIAVMHGDALYSQWNNIEDCRDHLLTG